MSKQIEIGDTVVIHGVVIKVENTVVTYLTPNGCNRYENIQDIHEVIPKPYTPKIGDVVRYRTGRMEYRIVGIYDGKVYLKQMKTTVVYEVNETEALVLVKELRPFVD